MLCSNRSRHLNAYSEVFGLLRAITLPPQQLCFPPTEPRAQSGYDCTVEPVQSPWHWVCVTFALLNQKCHGTLGVQMAPAHGTCNMWAVQVGMLLELTADYLLRPSLPSGLWWPALDPTIGSSLDAALGSSAGMAPAIGANRRV